MEAPKIAWISGLLRADVREVDPEHVLVDRVIHLLDASEATLWPIIGRRGTTMLQAENLKALAGQYPWLSVPNTHNLTPTQFLRAVLLDQTPAGAAACAEAVLQNFYKLLVDLVGLSVTDALLRPIWERTHASFAQGI
jgi:hypothetical protein